MEKILVLISTYNGQKYLEQQLNSLIKQIDVNIDILVRDDGSTDGTPLILDKWSKEGRLQWYSGKNLKPAQSFMDLIFNSSDYKYYAFCDQDDVWDPDKLISAIKSLETVGDKPALYFSSVRLVDQDLNLIRPISKLRKYSLAESLIRNNVIGCTMVINDAMIKHLKNYRPNYLQMHDSWIYKVCLCVGGIVIVDPDPHMSYRQHSNNVIGVKINKFARLKKRLQFILSREKYNTVIIAKELLNGYSHIMSNDNKVILYKYLNYKKSFFSKMNFIMDKNINLGRKEQKILFAIEVFLNKF